ncbi:hypothetical protein E2562_036753 [Oryza meyeriana var. granulata]|uniref:Uncharacterized protein n=1 Tax=Oryza meyeriana var. granulata TaxID=110450 RepID=A0A6G1DSG7_9ORYZ|nr:hypothetical protein E2562_036753 [Oryza meyeriana var. granulata]
MVLLAVEEYENWLLHKYSYHQEIPFENGSSPIRLFANEGAVGVPYNGTRELEKGGRGNWSPHT